MTDIDIDKLFEAARRLPPLTGKVVISPPPNAEAQSEDQADAMVAAMIASWKRSIDEVDRLRAENQRLRAIEAAARDAMRQIDRTLWLEHETGFLHDLRNNARICDLRAALATKEEK